MSWVNKRAEGVGPYDVLDTFGRQIQQGDLIMVRGDGSEGIFWRVAEMRPDLRPKEGTNISTVIVTLIASSTPVVAGGRPIMEFIKVRDVSEDPEFQEAMERQRQAQDKGKVSL